jgi:hypothetical protein
MQEQLMNTGYLAARNRYAQPPPTVHTPPTEERHAQTEIQAQHLRREEK